MDICRDLNMLLGSVILGFMCNNLLAGSFSLVPKEPAVQQKQRSWAMVFSTLIRANLSRKSRLKQAEGFYNLYLPCSCSSGWSHATGSDRETWRTRRVTKQVSCHKCNYNEKMKDANAAITLLEK